MQHIDFNQTNLYINRELSLLEFNSRVLELALDTSIPLLARLRFLFICSSNIDEFFEVRVAGLKQQVTYGSSHAGADGLAPLEVLRAISLRTHNIVEQMYNALNEIFIPELAAENIHLLVQKNWTKEQKKWVKQYFRNDVLPVISPIALDSAHPFPQLANKSLNFIVNLEGKDAFGRDGGLAIVHVPRSIPRVCLAPPEIDPEGKFFFFLTSVIHEYVGELFPGMRVKGCYQFRITRNSDLLLDEEEIEDLALALKTSLFSRSYGSAVRLEIDESCPEEIADYLLQKHDLHKDELYRVNGPVNLSRFMMILKLIDRPELNYPSFTAGTPDILKRKTNIFDVIRKNDILLYHPYQSFQPVLDLIRQATIDPDVLAIKQTLYRTGADSQIINALVDAARAGKEVTTVIELRARFDEAPNIELANRLQEAGVLVVYGVVGYKTHAKMMLIVRRENNKLCRYAHLGTGNYHASTAREYTDFGLLTHNKQICDDVHEVFQQLTGIGKEIHTEKLLHAPFTYFSTMMELVQQEIKSARQGKPAHIIAKMNSLTDTNIIRLLYEASQAGVKIELIVRGICCLRPGIKGISENITVRSIMGRFLEHSRVFYFYHNGKEKLFLSSADWMERNFYHRVEVCFPILDSQIKQQIKTEVLDVYLADNCQSWKLASSGEYTRNRAKQRYCAQENFLKNLSE